MNDRWLDGLMERTRYATPVTTGGGELELVALVMDAVLVDVD